MPGPVLLSGDNPQIPKGAGEGPVRAYLDAIPGWKGPIAQRLDALITDQVPGVHKAIKWNSPFYGTQQGLWFASFHCFTRYLKLTFFQGMSLTPLPPEPSKVDAVRYLHLPQDPPVDEAQLRDWIDQAARLPGTRL